MKCCYYKCKNRNNALFRFPVKNPELLAKWVENSGNNELKNMTSQQLYNKRLCMDHFHKHHVRILALRHKLIGLAVPIPYGKSWINSTEDDNNTHSEGNEINVSIRPLPSAKTSINIYEKCEFNPRKVLNTYTRKKRKAEFQITPLCEVKVEPFDQYNEVVEANASRTKEIECNIKLEPKEEMTPNDNALHIKLEPMDSNYDDAQTYIKTEPISGDESKIMEQNTMKRKFYIKIKPNSENIDHNKPLEPKSTDGELENLKMEANDVTECFIKTEPEDEETLDS